VTPRGVALVLHGGKVRSHAQVRANQFAVLRMRPFTKQLHEAGLNQGLVVASVLFGVRGWNNEEQSPVADVARVLDEVRSRYGRLPVALVGHSMGGRAALFAAGDKSVTGVIGLAPWIEPGDPYLQLADRRLVIIHGGRDRWTDIKASQALVQQVQPLSKGATFIEMQRDGHGMLSRASEWHALTTEFTLDALGLTSARTPAANILQTAANGVTNLVI
jgi:pimeloyl-ACP methyl ester carboxylesterase